MSDARALQAMAGGAPAITLHAGDVAFELVRIPPGEFQLGSPEDEEGRLPNESPVRRVSITRPFYMGRFQVTHAAYESIAGRNPSSFRGAALAMDQITRPRAIEFCELVAARSGARVRLPSEAQWEHACRAGTTTRYHTGNGADDLERAGWVSTNAGDTVHPVGEKEANAFGLYDMHGNVWELCADFLGGYASVAASDPAGPPDHIRVAMRGGGWTHGPDSARSASRFLADDRFGGAGIRIVVDPPG